MDYDKDSIRLTISVKCVVTTAAARIVSPGQIYAVLCYSTTISMLVTRTHIYDTTRV